MTMRYVLDLVNGGKAVYKFSRFGSVFSGLDENSFTPSELAGNGFGFLKRKGQIFFRKLK